MIVTVRPGADPKVVERALVGMGLWVDKHIAPEDGRVQLGIAPHSKRVDAGPIRALPGVEQVAERPSATPRLDAMPRVVEIAGHRIGVGEPPVVMAGPCSVESEARIDAIAARLAARGVKFLRGGAFKPRTSPYSFQGHGQEALRWMRRAAQRHGMAMVTEAMGAEEQEMVAEMSDLVQIGSRNMHNYSLLKSVAGFGKPMLLKRGMAATVEEWLGSAEYCLLHGAASVVLCERGIRSFDPSTRNLLDLSSVALLSQVHRLPVVADPSHAAGRRDLIGPLARGAIAVGAAGVMLETHPAPEEALSDGPQALLPDELDAILEIL